MNINNIKDLERIIKMCRKTGVNSLKLGELELNLGLLPIKKQQPVDFSSDFPEASIPVPQFRPYTQSTPDNNKQLSSEEVQVIADKIATSELTADQLLFYSSAGHSEQ
jgi:hypothetical protein